MVVTSWGEILVLGEDLRVGPAGPCLPHALCKAFVSVLVLFVLVLFIIMRKGNSIQKLVENQTQWSL